jgi:uncharacterized membrane protein
MKIWGWRCTSARCSLPGERTRGGPHERSANDDIDPRRHRQDWSLRAEALERCLQQGLEAMSHRVLFLVTLGSALACGLVAGVFFAFSTFVMPALARLPAAQGIAAMQAINVAAINRWFMGAFLGTAAACVLLAISSLLAWPGPGARFQLGGSVLYLVGAVLVTVACNVPLNEALAAVEPDSVAGASLWPGYVAAWTTWNHVRAAASLLAAALLTIALVK